MQNRHPADHLADVRFEIKRLEVEEAKLRAYLAYTCGAGQVTSSHSGFGPRAVARTKRSPGGDPGQVDRGPWEVSKLSDSSAGSSWVLARMACAALAERSYGPNSRARSATAFPRSNLRRSQCADVALRDGTSAEGPRGHGMATPWATWTDPTP